MPEPINGFRFKDGSIPGTCKVCGAPAWSARSNRCAEHKVEPAPKKKKDAKPKKAADAPPARGDAAEPEVSSVPAKLVAAASKITPRTFSANAPTAKEWEDKLTSLVTLLSMVYVQYAVVSPYHLSDDDAAMWIERLGMTDDEAESIVEPCSFLIAKTEVNKKHGREAIEVLAFAPAILNIVEWANRVSEFRREMERQQGGGRVVNIESARAPQTGSGAEGRPYIANFVGNTDPDQAPTRQVDRGNADLDQPS